MKNLFSTDTNETNIFDEMDYESVNLLGKRLDKVTKKFLLLCEKKRLKNKFKSFVSEIKKNNLNDLNLEDQENTMQEESSLMQNSNNELISKLYEKMFNNKFDQNGQFSNDKNIKDMMPDGEFKEFLVSDLHNESCTDPLFDFESSELLYKTRKIFVTEKGIQISQKNDASTDTVDIPPVFFESNDDSNI